MFIFIGSIGMEDMIRQLTSVLFFFLFIGVATSAAQGMTEPSLVVHLYPDGQHADRGIVEGGVAVTLGPREANQTDTTEFYWERDGSLNAVSDSARVVIYLPDTRIRNGQMILICPGGGYNELMFRSEGTYAARLLTRKGYSVGIVCYRMPTGHAEIPLTDVQNAFRYCRHHAGEWGISQIGIMGMSAGGHLAATASTLYTDAVTRPDFTILFYPVVSAGPGLIHRGSFRKLTGLSREALDAASARLYREAPDHLSSSQTVLPSGATPAVAEPDSLTIALSLVERFSPDRHITADTPPALLFHSADDRGVPAANSLRYFQLLREAGVPAELHVFPSGGHGWGFNTLETAGYDKLEPYRSTFFSALDAFLLFLRSQNP